MITLRDDQRRELTRSAFVTWAEAHVRRCFPEVCADLGRNGTARRVRLGLEIADRYGVPVGPDACRLIDLTFSLGEGFLDTQDLASLREILDDPAPLSPSRRVRKLMNAAKAHLAAQEQPSSETSP